jgi:hypothetical protein
MGFLRQATGGSAATRAFQPNEETVNTLVEMGFTRTNCVNAIQMARSNDIAQLVPLLLDNFDGFPRPMPISNGMSFESPESREPEPTAAMDVEEKGTDPDKEKETRKIRCR